jgi:hypothetical protein
MDLATSLESVSDLPSFLEFARLLAKDRADAVLQEATHPSPPFGPEAGGWENTSIERFLEHAIRWAEDTEMGASQGLSPDNPWKRFAVFLYCGKIYE